MTPIHLHLLSRPILGRARGKRRLAGRIATVLTLALICRSAVAQGGLGEKADPLQGDINGIHLYSTSVYGGYFSSPQVSPGALTVVPLQSDVGYGASASLGWNYLHSGSGISVLYTPSYNGFSRYSNLNRFSHDFSLTMHNKRDPGRKWHTSFSTETSIATPTQFLFAPNALAQLADAPATFDELAQGVVAGRFTNDQIASLLTGATTPQSAAQVVLFGDYFLTAAVQGMVTYAPSSRLSIEFSASGMRLQSLPHGTADTGSGYLIPATWGGTGSVQIGYSLTPRTQVQVAVGTARMMSRVLDTYNSTSTVSLNRIMSRRWFVELHAGSAVLTPVRQTGNLDQKPHPIWGGGIGFKTESQTFMAQYSRVLSDPYGIGAVATSSATAAWSWRPHGSAWSELASASWQEMAGTTALLSNSWNGRVSLNRALTHQTGISIAYALLSNRGLMAKALPNRSMDAVVVSFYWIPGGEKQRDSTPQR